MRIHFSIYYSLRFEVRIVKYIFFCQIILSQKEWLNTNLNSPCIIVFLDFMLNFKTFSFFINISHLLIYFFISLSSVWVKVRWSPPFKSCCIEDVYLFPMFTLYIVLIQEIKTNLKYRYYVIFKFSNLFCAYMLKKQWYVYLS